MMAVVNIVNPGAQVHRARVCQIFAAGFNYILDMFARILCAYYIIFGSRGCLSRNSQCSRDTIVVARVVM